MNIRLLHLYMQGSGDRKKSGAFEAMNKIPDSSKELKPRASVAGSTDVNRDFNDVIIDVSKLDEEKKREVERELSAVKEVAAVLLYCDGSSQLQVCTS